MQCFPLASTTLISLHISYLLYGDYSHLLCMYIYVCVCVCVYTYNK